MPPIVLPPSPAFATAGDAADRLSAAGFRLRRHKGPVPAADLLGARCETGVRLTGLSAGPAGADDLLTLDRSGIAARAVNAKDLSR